VGTYFYLPTPDAIGSKFYIGTGPKTKPKPRGPSASAAGEIQAAAGGDQVPDPGCTHERTPKSVLAKACNYTLTLWLRLTRFLEHLELELSNNLAENAMRPVALGRRDWIHIGSEEAGPRVAAIVSVVETCRRLKIPTRDYLCSILPGLANFPINRIAELTPAAWLARN
jgi:hypothetical protein